jgi:hypothetical protein
VSDETIDRVIAALAGKGQPRNVGPADDYIDQRMRAWRNQYGEPDLVTLGCPAVLTAGAIIHAHAHGVTEFPIPNDPDEFPRGECFLCETPVYIPRQERYDELEARAGRHMRPVCLVCAYHHLPAMTKHHQFLDVSQPGVRGN